MGGPGDLAIAASIKCLKRIFRTLLTGLSLVAGLACGLDSARAYGPWGYSYGPALGLYGAPQATPFGYSYSSWLSPVPSTSMVMGYTPTYVSPSMGSPLMPSPFMGAPMMQQQPSPWMSMLPMLLGALPSLFGSGSSMEASACLECGRATYRSPSLERIPASAYGRPGVGERVPDYSSPSPRGTIRAHRTGGENSAHRAPIWNSFIRNFKQCAPGCEPAQYAAFGHRDNLSCHPTGEAIDVGAMICEGRTYRAIDRGRFEEMVTCMRGKMKTLYRNGWHVTKGHHDHAHFSDGCIDRGRRVY